MDTASAEITRKLRAEPDDVFALLTDVDRLPEWNTHIDHVVEAPSQLAEGAQWVIEMRVMGARWNSRSTVQTVDPEARVFSHRTQSDDGNPSYALWTWLVREQGVGSEVRVRWQLNPKTFARRRFFARMRHRQLKREVWESLAAVNRLLAHDRALA